MSEFTKVKEIMAPIEDYDRVNIDAQLCDAMSILKRNYENLKAGKSGNYHKTLLVVEGNGNIVGKLSMYDLIRGLVPEPAKTPEVSKAYNAMRSGRARDVSVEVGDAQEHFKWLSSSFLELIKQEAHKECHNGLFFFAFAPLRDKQIVLPQIHLHSGQPVPPFVFKPVKKA